MDPDLSHDWSFSEGPDPAPCRRCPASRTVHDLRASQPCPGRMMSEAQEIALLQAEQKELQRRYAENKAKLDKFRVKCPTCRCRILPGEICQCCASRAGEPETEPLI